MTVLQEMKYLEKAIDDAKSDFIQQVFVRTDGIQRISESQQDAIASEREELFEKVENAIGLFMDAVYAEIMDDYEDDDYDDYDDSVGGITRMK